MAICYIQCVYSCNSCSFTLSFASDLKCDYHVSHFLQGTTVCLNTGVQDLQIYTALISRELHIGHPKIMPRDTCRWQFDAPPSLFFSRLNKPSSLSPSSYIILSSSQTGLAALGQVSSSWSALSCLELDTVLQVQSHECRDLIFSLVLLATVLPIQPRMWLTTFDTRASWLTHV